MAICSRSSTRSLRLAPGWAGLDANTGQAGAPFLAEPPTAWAGGGEVARMAPRLDEQETAMLSPIAAAPHPDPLIHVTHTSRVMMGLGHEVAHAGRRCAAAPHSRE